MKYALFLLLLLTSSLLCGQSFTCPTGYTHCVQVSLTPGTDCTNGTITCQYNYYRATVSGGPYTLVNSTPTSSTSLIDATSQMIVGLHLYYVVRSYNSAIGESANSNEASTVIPLGPPQSITTTPK